ncbi:MAG: hypothetical protein ACD_43C00244G0006 [uncultured bacterium]|nr:MAG: hypothetical protein ACD_43C00244G0006 [uncultured bacterium]
MKNKIILAVIVVVIMALSIIWLLFFYSRAYYNDRLIVYYQDEAEKSNALLVDLTSYNILPYYYGHEYHVIAFNDEKTIEKKYNFHTTSSAISADGFLTEHVNINNYNLQDESYSLQLGVNNQQYSIDLQNLPGDFIVNNTLQRLTYVNLGNTTILVDGKLYDAQFALTKTLSSNIAQATLGVGVTGSGDNIFLADQQGGLYLIDQTEITSGAGEYDSHNWVLYKKGTILKKFVDFDNFELSNITDSTVKLNVSSLDNATMTLHPLSTKQNDRSIYYLFDGEIIDNLGERLLGGLRLHYEY